MQKRKRGRPAHTAANRRARLIPRMDLSSARKTMLCAMFRLCLVSTPWMVHYIVFSPVSVCVGCLWLWGCGCGGHDPHDRACGSRVIHATCLTGAHMRHVNLYSRKHAAGPSVWLWALAGWGRQDIHTPLLDLVFCFYFTRTCTHGQGHPLPEPCGCAPSPLWLGAANCTHRMTQSITGHMSAFQAHPIRRGDGRPIVHTLDNFARRTNAKGHTNCRSDCHL